LTIFGLIWLLFALVIDEIIAVEIQLAGTSTSSKEGFWCGWQVITSDANEVSDYEYTSCKSATCATNNTAGQVWIAFNIVAIVLGYLTLGYGLFLDIRQGGFDMSTVREIIKVKGCTYSFGYTTLGTLTLFFWQLLGLIIYNLVETCSKKEMWTSILSGSTISSFSWNSGASLGLDIASLSFIVLGLLVLLFIRIQYKQLPRSKTLSESTKQVSPSILQSKPIEKKRTN